MSYLLIKGKFHIHYPDIPRNGPEPDGDTLKFEPDRPELAQLLRRDGQPQPDFNGRGMINLRFEGIDALETHFSGRHQNLSFAKGARDFLLEQAGFGQVSFFEDKPNKVETVENHPVNGYILSNGLDGHGRIVSFVYGGDINQADGSMVHIDEELLKDSFNADLLSAGQAYPLFYFSLPAPLRTILKDVAAEAISDEKGLWAEDVSLPGKIMEITKLQDLDDMVIWPKLFRRLVSYFRSDFENLDGFDEWMRADPINRDDRMLLPDNFDSHFHNIVEVVSSTELRMTHSPSDLIIIPDDFVMPETSLTRRLRERSISI